MAVKRKGPHPSDALTEAFVTSVRDPGVYGDGNGLYLRVDRSGAKRWILRTVVQSKRRDLGLGSLTLISLAEARQKAREYRKIAREGGDPLQARREARAVRPCSFVGRDVG